MRNIQSLGLIMLALSTAISTTHAANITVDIVAEVALVDDFGGVLGGTIQVGDIITGQYTFSSITADINPAPTIGTYPHTTNPYGISVNAGGFVFETDPNDVQFFVDVIDDHGVPASDAFLLNSLNNLPLSNGAFVSSITWQLDDPTTNAVSSDAILTVPPDLNAWQSIFGLRMEGCLIPDEFGFCGFGDSDSFLIGAHVTSAELSSVPIPAAVWLFSSGLVGLLGFAKRNAA